MDETAVAGTLEFVEEADVEVKSFGTDWHCELGVGADGWSRLFSTWYGGIFWGRIWCAVLERKAPRPRNV